MSLLFFNEYLIFFKVKLVIYSPSSFPNLWAPPKIHSHSLLFSAVNTINHSNSPIQEVNTLKELRNN